MMETIVGTAGHIDHGKTALVKALTGVDADRLPEEKRRGITIDIGFAEMTVGDAHFGFVDVPGHERFVKNMLAGASGIDLVLLVVAADEGVMPQTREHFDICRLLGVESGLIALTKADLVDADTLDMARLDVAELVAGSFLEDAPMIAVSSKNGVGINELRDALVAQARASGGAIDARSPMPGRGLSPRDRDRVTRLPIDRSFSMKGFGAVVTGTLASGDLAEGDELELLPEEEKVRVRGLQSHGRKVSKVESGRRVAVNLAGIDHGAIVRGMMLVEPNVLLPTQVFDAQVEALPSAARPLRSRQRVRVHIGTAETLARVRILSETGTIRQASTGFAQLRLESPVVVVPGERFIIRSYSPQTTVAGGSVVDNAPVRHRRKELPAVERRLSALLDAADDPARTVGLLVETAGSVGIDLRELQAKTGLNNNVLTTATAAHVSKGTINDLGGRLISAAAFDGLMTRVQQDVAAFHKTDPLANGISRELLRERSFAFLPDEVVDAVLAAAAARGEIVLEKETVRLSTHRAELSPDEAAVTDKILSAYQSSGLEVPRSDEVVAEAIAGTRLAAADARKLLRRLVDSGKITKVTDDFYFSKDALEELRTKLKTFAGSAADRHIDVSKFKDIAGVSRKYAIPLLEYFDREHVTARVGDKRIIL
jgi:selenocysteine-specific elongation factor